MFVPVTVGASHTFIHMCDNMMLGTEGRKIMAARTETPRAWVHRATAIASGIERHYDTWQQGTGLPGHNYRREFLHDIAALRRYQTWTLLPADPRVEAMRALVGAMLQVWDTRGALNRPALATLRAALAAYPSGTP